MSDLLLLHLNAKACSGRGVKFRVLSPGEYDAAVQKAAILIGKDGSAVDYELAKKRECIKAILVSVTKQTGIRAKKGPDGKDENPLLDPSLVWEPLDAEKLEISPTHSLERLFTTKDLQILAIVFRDYHEILQSDVDDIVGKVVAVSDD